MGLGLHRRRISGGGIGASNAKGSAPSRGTHTGVGLLHMGEAFPGERWPTGMRSSCIVPPIRPGIDARRFRIPPVSAVKMGRSGDRWTEQACGQQQEVEEADCASRAELIVRQVGSTSCCI
eukprot:scaffold2179_cov84-Isochrysis_galbana.AAC.3